MILTNSEIQTAKTCLRKEFLSYQLRLRPDRDQVYFRIGSAVHEGLDLAKQGKPQDEAILAACELVEGYDRSAVMAMLICYFQYTKPVGEIIASELSFQMPIINPATGVKMRVAEIAGKIDGIVRLNDGRLAILEHKTTSDDLTDNSVYWKRLRIDSQISLYYVAAQYLGYDVETIIYDVIRKPTIKPYKETENKKYKKDGTLYANMHDADETPESYGKRCIDAITEKPWYFYQRKEIPRLADDIAEANYEVWQWAKMIHDCKTNHRWPRNTGACVGFGICQYFDICTNGYDVTSGIVPDGFKIVDEKHQELI